MEGGSAGAEWFGFKESTWLPHRLGTLSLAPVCSAPVTLYPMHFIYSHFYWVVGTGAWGSNKTIQGRKPAPT